ncbi:hypothetical protein ES704_01639 [subsurface metagenome]|jgi:hypothetical protein
MAIKTVTTMLCNKCKREIPTGGSNHSIHIEQSRIHGTKGSRTLNGDYCGKDCFEKEIKDAGCY